MWKTLTCVAVLILGLGALAQSDPSKKTEPAVEAKPTPAVETTALPTPLPADLFQGRIREGYKVAAEIPEVLASLACYCGCNKSAGHRHLLDCFVDDHGAG